MTQLLAGALAGFLATVPMTLTMTAAYKYLPRPQRGKLPPRVVAMRVLGRLGLRGRLSEDKRTGVTLLSHFGYGSGSGALYGQLAGELPLPTLMKGVGYGLGVWTFSYLGLLPAAGLYRSASDEPAERNLLVLGSHIVWGAALSLSYAALRGANRRDEKRQIVKRGPGQALPKLSEQPNPL